MSKIITFTLDSEASPIFVQYYIWKFE